MGNPGQIYVLVNSAMPGMVKVGKTTRDPEDRAKELSGSTGVPTPFVVAYSTFFADVDRAEIELHQDLAHRGYRVSANREFFLGKCKDIVELVAQKARLQGPSFELEDCTITSSSYSDFHHQIAEQLMRLGYELQNFDYTPEKDGDIESLYKAALALGHPMAHFLLGCFYGFDRAHPWLYGRSTTSSTQTLPEAIAHLEQAADQGMVLAHALAAQLHWYKAIAEGQDKDVEVIGKHWSLFLKNIDADLSPFDRCKCSPSYVRKPEFVLDHLVHRYNDQKPRWVASFVRAYTSHMNFRVEDLTPILPYKEHFMEQLVESIADMREELRTLHEELEDEDPEQQARSRFSIEWNEPILKRCMAVWQVVNPAAHS